MGTIIIRNQSSLTDPNAIMHVLDYEIDKMVGIKNPIYGTDRIKITQTGDTYTVTDAEEVE